jgi:ADP-heptose:LPS heptosyltransferase
VFRILICRITHSLGNTLMLTPLIRELEAQYPGAEIDILTRSAAAADIFGAFASVREIYQLPAHAVRHPGQFLRVLRRMRRVHYDLVIDPSNCSQTGRWMTLLARGRFKLGFAGAAPMAAVTHAVERPPQPVHAGQLAVLQLRTALGRTAPTTFPNLDIGLTAAEREQGARSLAQLVAPAGVPPGGDGIIGIFANATGHKSLGSVWWQAFMDVMEANCSGHTFVEIVPISAQSVFDGRYPAYYSSSIRRLSGVLSGLSLFISADCGVMHLACASGTPTIGIFTVTNPDEWGPYGPNDRVVDGRGLSAGEVAQRVIAR